MNEEATMLTTSALKERGWTLALIKKFLGEPDDTRENPHYRSAAPMRLYTIDRVEVIEKTPDFQEAHIKAIARSKHGKEVAERKANELIEQARCLPILVDVLQLDQ